MFYRSLDAGATWQQDLNPLPYGIRQLAAIGDRAIAAISDSGAILLSTDDGVRWSLQHRAEAKLYCIAFIDSLVGIAGGESGVLLRTTDGGYSWDPLPELGTATVFLALTPASVNSFVAIGVSGDFNSSRVVAYSDDAGQTWHWATLPYTLLNTTALVGVDEGPDGDLVAVGNPGVLIVSADQGHTWGIVSNSAFHSSIGSVAALRSMAGDNGDTMIVVNDVAGPDYGGWSRTTDGGSTWRYGVIAALGSFRAIVSIGATDLVAMTLNGFLYKSSDVGATWHLQIPRFSPSPVTTWSFEATDPGHWTICGDSLLYTSTDRGATWTGVPFPWATTITHSRSLAPGIINVIASNGRELASPRQVHRIYRTDDGGLSWRVLLESRTGYDAITDVCFRDSLHGFASIGWWGPEKRNDGFILRTADAGRSWDSIRIRGGNPLRIRFFNALNGIVVGDSMSIWETTDGGVTWECESSLSGPAPLYDVALMQQRRTIIVSGHGVLARKQLDVPIPSNVRDLPLGPGPTKRPLRVWPNPAIHGYFNVELEGATSLRAVRVRMVNTLGEVVLDEEARATRSVSGSSFSIVAAGLAPGPYQILADDGISSWRVVVAVP